MLKQYSEEYFKELHIVAQNRLEPGNLTVFIWATLIVNGIFVGLSALGINENVVIRYSFLPILVKVAIGALLLQLIIAIFPPSLRRFHIE